MRAFKEVKDMIVKIQIINTCINVLIHLYHKLRFVRVFKEVRDMTVRIQIINTCIKKRIWQ